MKPEDEVVILRMAARGVPVARIAAAVGLSASRVERWLAKKPRAVEGLKGELERIEAEHHFGMQALLPKARAALEAALDGKGQKLGVDAAKYVHEALVARPAQRSEVTVQGTVSHDLSPVFEKIAGALGALRDASQGASGLARVRVGIEALGRSTAISERQEEGE